MSADAIIKHFVSEDEVELCKAGITISTISTGSIYFALQSLEDMSDEDTFFRNAEKYIRGQTQSMPGFPRGLDGKSHSVIFDIVRVEAKKDGKESFISNELCKIMPEDYNNVNEGIVALGKGFSIGKLITSGVRENISLCDTGQHNEFRKSVQKQIIKEHGKYLLGFPSGITVKDCQKIMGLFGLYRHSVFYRQYFF